MARRLTIVGVVVCLIMLAPAAMAIMCYPVEIMLPYSVCTYYSSTGDRVCHTQYGWFDGWECWSESGGGEPYYPPPSGGGSPSSNPPPDCEIVGISDENTNQTVLSVWANDAVVEMSVAINGSTVNTVSGRTDQFMLQGVGLFGDGTTPITVSCRNVANVYDQSVAEVHRRSDVYNGTTLTHGYWQKLSLDGEPEEFWGDWYRAIDLLATNTSYSVATLGERNGEWEHLETEDRIDPMGETPKTIWDAVYQIDNPQLYNVYQSYPCKYELIRDSMCTSVYAFSRGGSPTGRGLMTGMQVPFQSTLDVWILAGQTVSVTPY